RDFLIAGRHSEDGQCMAVLDAECRGDGLATDERQMEVKHDHSGRRTTGMFHGLMTRGSELVREILVGQNGGQKLTCGAVVFDDQHNTGPSALPRSLGPVSHPALTSYLCRQEPIPASQMVLS